MSAIQEINYILWVIWFNVLWSQTVQKRCLHRVFKEMTFRFILLNINPSKTWLSIPKTQLWWTVQFLSCIKWIVKKKKCWLKKNQRSLKYWFTFVNNFESYSTLEFKEDLGSSVMRLIWYSHVSCRRQVGNGHGSSRGRHVAWPLYLVLTVECPVS